MKRGSLDITPLIYTMNWLVAFCLLIGVGLAKYVDLYQYGKDAQVIKAFVE
jgi:hypothetical protein